MQTDTTIVTVVTSSKLSADQHAILRRLVEQKMGKNVDIQEQIDPSLLGGVTIKIGDQVYDTSIAGKLTKLESQVPEVVIVTAQPLTEAIKKRLISEVKASLGSTVKVTMNVDEQLLGGFKITFNSREYDSTLRTKIEKLRSQLLHTTLV